VNVDQIYLYGIASFLAMTIKNMTIYIFGNPDYEPDALPLKILPELKKRLPAFDFVIKDPNEDWDYAMEKLIIIDTIQGIEKVTIFTSLDQFESTPHLTMHDFDLGMKLKWLSKLKKLPPFLIIGVPMRGNPEKITTELTVILERSDRISGDS